MSGCNVLHLCCLQLNVASLSVCVIDDCHFQNVPFVRVTAKKLQLEHYLRSDPDGAAVVVLAAEYFNRTILHWEPLLEEWGWVGLKEWKWTGLRSRVGLKEQGGSWV